MLRRRTRLSVIVASLVVVLLVCAAFAIMAAAFSDVDSGDHYAEAIKDLSDLGIIGGFKDGTFRPGELVTRQQFAKMIVLTLGLLPTENDICPFSDVDVSGPGELYPDNYVALAEAKGITRGRTADSFAPFDNITRSQVMSMVVRSAPLAGISLRSPSDAYYSDSRYTQRLNDDPTHGLNAQIAEFNGLLWGIYPDGPGSWDASKNATRGEVAQVLWRLRQKMAPPATTTSTTELPSNLLYSDDFSDPASGWPVKETADFKTVYDKGAYAFSVFGPEKLYYAWHTQRFDDVVVEANAYSMYWSGDWEYGLVFRLLDRSNFYYLSVVGDATATMWRVTDGQWEQISAPVELPPIAESGWRAMSVVMLGDELTGYVDGAQVGPAYDSQFAAGNVGFAVGTLAGQPDVTVYFDDLAVYRIVY